MTLSAPVSESLLSPPFLASALQAQHPPPLQMSHNSCHNLFLSYFLNSPFSFQN